MATRSFGSPPAGQLRYQDYRVWLEGVLWNMHCAFCVLRHKNLQIEHYEPQSMATGRVNDPTNLLLGCSNCNGPGGKFDYHPCHATRARYKTDTTGHLVIDIRVDDFAVLFEVKENGELVPRPGSTFDRAAWNVALLDLRRWNEDRREVLQRLAACEELAAAVTDSAAQSILRRLLPSLARDYLFFEVMGIAVSANLHALVVAERSGMMK